MEAAKYSFGPSTAMLFGVKMEVVGPICEVIDTNATSPSLKPW